MFSLFLSTTDMAAWLPSIAIAAREQSRMRECDACRTQFDPNTQRLFLGRHTFCHDCQARFQYLTDCIREITEAGMGFYNIEYNFTGVLDTTYNDYVASHELRWRRMTLRHRRYLLRRVGVRIWTQFAHDYARQFGRYTERRVRRKLLRTLRRHHYELDDRLKESVKGILCRELSILLGRIRARRGPLTAAY